MPYREGFSMTAIHHRKRDNLPVRNGNFHTPLRLYTVIAVYLFSTYTFNDMCMAPVDPK